MLTICSNTKRANQQLTASEGILENLLETQELENRKVHSRVESEAALVRTECGVELNTVSAVYLDLSLIILPCDTELDNTLRNGGHFQSGFVLWMLLEKTGMFESGGKL
jgi:hypothetical protein